MASRRISARRTLAVIAAVLTVPWPLALIPIGLADDEPRLALFAAVVASAAAAAPLAAGRRRFGWLAAGLGVALLALGTVTAIVAGFLLWPGGLAFLFAATVSRDRTWRLRGIVVVVAGLLGVAAVAVAAVFGV